MSFGCPLPVGLVVEHAVPLGPKERNRVGNQSGVKQSKGTGRRKSQVPNERGWATRPFGAYGNRGGRWAKAARRPRNDQFHDPGAVSLGQLQHNLEAAHLKYMMAVRQRHILHIMHAQAFIQQEFQAALKQMAMEEAFHGEYGYDASWYDAYGEYGSYGHFCDYGMEYYEHFNVADASTANYNAWNYGGMTGADASG